MSEKNKFDFTMEAGKTASVNQVKQIKDELHRLLSDPDVPDHVKMTLRANSLLARFEKATEEEYV